MIRSTVKALLLHNGKLLVNRCVTTYGETYYDLPGGGQHPFETLEQALYRELLEETGYSICVGRFAAMLEEIARNPKMRENYPAYAHRILHIFHADLAADTPVQPSETDFQQQESLWVPLAEADRLVFRPQLLCGQISRLCQENAVFLGSCFSDYPE